MKKHIEKLIKHLEIAMDVIQDEYGIRQEDIDSEGKGNSLNRGNEIYNQFMKYVKKTLLTIYQNWFLLSFLSMALEIHFFNATVWMLSLPILLAVIFMYVTYSKHCKTLRFLTWPTYKYVLAARIRKAGPLVAYPMMLWLELEAEKDFLAGGYNALMKSERDKIDRIQTGYEEMFSTLKGDGLTNG